MGGSATNCVSLALELKRQGMDIELLASVPPDGMHRLAGGPVADILRPLSSGGRGLIGKSFGTLHALRCGLKTRLQEERYDIVHAHSGTYPYAVVPLAADRRTSVRLHSLYCPLGAKGGVYGKWWERSALARLAFERLDRVIAVTENVRDSLQSAGVRPEKIELVRMCVDTRRFCPGIPRKPPKYFTAADAAVRLLFVGNASRQKGLMELLQAVRLLHDRGLRASLVAALENQCGIREYAQGYEQAGAFVRRTRLESNVRFVGLVDSVEELYAEADLVVIPWNTSRGPSDYPMVVLEALAMGKCVVCTPVGGCPELLAPGPAGILTGGFSAQDIAAAVEYAVKNPVERERMERLALQRSREFSLTDAAGDLLTLYENLLKGKTRRHVECGS